MREIESLEEWRKLEERLVKYGWQLRQMQYGTYAPEGFHAWFRKTGKPTYEVVTHNADVQRAIVRYTEK